VGAIFGAGAFYAGTRATLREIRGSAKGSREQLMRDIDGIGAKLRTETGRLGKQQQNFALALMLVADERKSEIAEILRVD